MNLKRYNEITEQINSIILREDPAENISADRLSRIGDGLSYIQENLVSTLPADDGGVLWHWLDAIRTLVQIEQMKVAV